MDQKPLLTKKQIAAGLILLMTIVALPFMFESLSRRGKSPVQVAVAPVDAQVTLDGTSIGSGITYVTPGEYTLIVSRDEFITYAADITITESSDEEANIIAIPLEPRTQLGREIEENSFTDYIFVEELGGIQAFYEGELFRQANPIVDQLPFSTNGLRIDFRQSGDSVSLIATAAGWSRGGSDSQTAEERVLESIRSIGFNPSDFDIEYKDSFEFDIPQKSDHYTIHYDVDIQASAGDASLEHGDKGFHLRIDVHPVIEDPFSFEVFTPTSQDFEKHRRDAIKSIRDSGYDPASFRIEYTPSSLNQKYGTNPLNLTEGEEGV